MATQPFSNEPVSTEERYESAANTSNLTVSASFGMVGMDEATPAGDMVLAGGLVSSNRALGMALLRLHSEWAASAKPRRVTAEGVERLAELIRLQDEKDRQSAATRGIAYQQPKAGPWQRANDEAHRWYSAEVTMLSTRLKSRREVIDKLTAWGAVKGIPAATISAALHHWLDGVCQVCDGHGLRFLEHAVARQCNACHGSGKVDRPEGSARVLNYIDDALNSARESLKRRLRAMR
jgi:hypothetical protein